MTPRLQEKYEKEVLPAMAEKFGRSNRLSLPRLQKVSVNMGVGSAINEKEASRRRRRSVNGKSPARNRLLPSARKAIAGFRLREDMADRLQGDACGKTRMYEFIDRLISLALPRVRDFRGVSRSAFDRHGNYSLGLAEQLVFPELNPDKFTRVQGMTISVRHLDRLGRRGAGIINAAGHAFSARRKCGRRGLSRYRIFPERKFIR